MPANALTVVHKFIRHELFTVSHAIAAVGPEDCEAVQKAISETTTLLHTHAEHEESGFEPQLRALNAGYAERMLADHQRLHAELEQINVAAAKLDSLPAGHCVQALLQLHLDWNRFVGGYLLHLDDEERTLFAIDDTIMPPVSVMAEGAAAMGEAEGKAFLEKLFAIISPAERELIEAARPGA